MSTDTQARLRAATVDVLRREGLAALSARTVASRAGVNQALIFYHFGSVAQLVDAACREATDASADQYRDAFATTVTFGELLDVGRELHERERAAGNVAMMAQLMAGAQHDEQLATTVRYCLRRWQAELEPAVARLLAGSPLALLVAPEAVAHAVSAGFLGLELYDGVDPAGAEKALDSLDRLGALVEVVDDLGPVARRALRAKLRRRPALTRTAKGSP